MKRNNYPGWAGLFLMAGALCMFSPALHAQNEQAPPEQQQQQPPDQQQQPPDQQQQPPDQGQQPPEQQQQPPDQGQQPPEQQQQPPEQQQQPPEQQQQPPDQGQQATPQSQTFAGTIMKLQDGKYALVTGKTAQGQLSGHFLDDQNDAKKYDGKKVRVTGSLDMASNTIHVSKIVAG